MRKYKVAVVDDNPIHFRVPLHRKFFENKQIDSVVYFFTMDDCSKRYQYETKKNNGFNLDLSGFEYRLLRNYCPFTKKLPPYRLWNFGIIWEIVNGNYDAVILYGYSSFGKKLAYLGALLSGTPVIFREEINEISGGKLKVFFKKFLYKILFKIPQAFLCSYTKNKKFYESFGVLSEKLFLHPCAVDNKLYRELAKGVDKKKVRKKLRIPEDANVFLSVGTIDARKNSFGLLKAFEKLGGDKNYLIYLGEGLDKKKIQRYIEDNRVENVKFFKFEHNYDKVAEYYSVADIFVIASVSDPSPKALNEAMNFSLPVIVSDGVGTAFDLVKNEKNGFVCKKSNIEELSKCMIKIISDKKRMKDMGKESLRIVSKWNFDEDIKATLKALDYVCDDEIKLRGKYIG